MSTQQIRNPALSVVVPTYQRIECVQRLLHALSQQTLAPEQYEVIVSMDGSDDGTREMVTQFARLYSPYRLVALWQPNAGRAAACNAGIRMARGEIIVLLDDDMEPAPMLLQAHAWSHRLQPRLGVIGAVPMRLDPRASAVEKYIGNKFNQHLTKLARADCVMSLRDFYSGNFSISRDVLLEAGLFDEAFKVYGYEDLELSLRLKQVGVQLRYEPTALAYQHYTKDFAGLAHDNQAKGSTSLLMARKHPECFDELKLNTYNHGSLLRRWARTALLGLHMLWPASTQLLVAAAQRIDSLDPTLLDMLYSFVLEYCYWLGVHEALRKQNVEAGDSMPHELPLQVTHSC